MPKSDRDPAVLAREREARLAARMAKEYLRSGAAEAALQFLTQVLSDPSCPKRTRVQAAKTLTVNAAKITAKTAQLRVEGQVANLTMADLLALAQGRPQEAPELPNSDPVVLPELQVGGPEGVDAFTATQQPDLLPSRQERDAQDQDEPEATEGSPLRSSAEPPADAPEGDERKEDPTESLGSTAPFVESPELDALLDDIAEEQDA